MKVKSESEVAQSCPTLSDPMDCSLPGSSIHGIFQARVLEWGAIALSEVKSAIISVMEFKYICSEDGYNLLGKTGYTHERVTVNTRQDTLSAN